MTLFNLQATELDTGLGPQATAMILNGVDFNKDCKCKESESDLQASDKAHILVFGEDAVPAKGSNGSTSN